MTNKGRKAGCITWNKGKTILHYNESLRAKIKTIEAKNETN